MADDGELCHFYVVNPARGPVTPSLPSAPTFLQVSQSLPSGVRLLHGAAASGVCSRSGRNDCAVHVLRSESVFHRPLAIHDGSVDPRHDECGPGRNNNRSWGAVYVSSSIIM